MAARETEAGLSGTIREILKLADRGPKPSLPVAEDYFRVFCRMDYGRALRKQFDRRQLTQLLAEFRSALPALNQQVFAITDLRRLAKIAADFGAVLQARSFEGREGRTLRGFYVNDRATLRRPLICVNTAIHRVGVAAAFWHELGHHLTHRVFGSSHERLNLAFSTNYQDHLERPGEIAADLVMIFGCYPKPAAQRLFNGARGTTAGLDVGTLVSKARPYIQSVTGWEFEKRLSANENLQILAGMIHVAKLRTVLLQEYGI